MKEKVLTPEKLVFNRGHEDFSKEEFIKYINPYFNQLIQVNRSNHLFVAVYGDGSKPDMTGYFSDTTINATINSRAAKAQRTGGKWAVYSTVG